MKKFAIILFAVALVAACSRSIQIESYKLQWQSTTGASPQAVNVFSTSATDTIGYVTGTGSDTSAVFPITRYMTGAFSIADTSASGDSASVTLSLYGASATQFDRGVPPWGRFTLMETFTISYETARDTLWLFNDYGPVQFGVIVATGAAANKKASAVTVEGTISQDKGW